MKKIAMLVLSIFLFITIVSAQEIINRTAMTDTLKNNDGTFTTKYYMGAVNMPDIDGNYKPFSEVVDISWNNGNIVYTWYDKEVRLQPFVIYNNNKYNILQIRQAFPNINFSSYIYKSRGNNKFGFNITGIPDNIKNNINYIVFELISSSNLTWNDVSRDGNNIYITDNLKLSFQDLIDSGFTLNFINKTYLAIGNVSGKNNLWLDPTITYNFNATHQNSVLFATNSTGCLDDPPPETGPIPSCGGVSDVTNNSALDSNDNSYIHVGSDGGLNNDDWALIKFKITKNISLISLFNWTYDGFIDNINYVTKAYIWNNSGSNWYYCGASSDINSTSDVTRNCSLSDSISNFFNSSDFIHLLLQQSVTLEATTSWSLDYVVLEVVYNNDPPVVTNILANNTLFSSLTNLNITYNITDTDSNVSNVTIYVYNTTNDLFFNSTDLNPTLNSQLGILINISLDGTYTYTINATDTTNLFGSGQLRTFRIDTAPPIINITTPINGTTLTSTSVNINYSVSDSDGNLNTCRWTQDGGISNTTLTCGVNITATFADGVTHNVTIYADDTAGNLNLSTVTFIISVPGGVGSSGGGGGDITTTVIQNTTWIIVTDTRSSKFDFTIPPGGLRERKIIFNNLESVEANIQIKCEDIAGDLCQYVKFNNPNEDTSLLQETFLTQMTLTNTTNEEKIMDFILDLPNNLTEGIYDFNIVGIDQLGNRETISVRVRIDSGIFTILIDKLLGSTRLSFLDFISKDIKAINILLLFLPLIILIPAILIIFAKLPYKNILAITISFTMVVIIFLFLD